MLKLNIINFIQECVFCVYLNNMKINLLKTKKHIKKTLLEVIIKLKCNFNYLILTLENFNVFGALKINHKYYMKLKSATITKYNF